MHQQSVPLLVTLPSLSQDVSPLVVQTRLLLVEHLCPLSLRVHQECPSLSLTLWSGFLMPNKEERGGKERERGGREKSLDESKTTIEEEGISI